jgi:hypothetical protein
MINASKTALTTKPPGTIPSVAKHFLEKRVAKELQKRVGKI